MIFILFLNIFQLSDFILNKFNLNFVLFFESSVNFQGGEHGYALQYVFFCLFEILNKYITSMVLTLLYSLELTKTSKWIDFQNKF